jgi:hypothetical protein
LANYLAGSSEASEKINADGPGWNRKKTRQTHGLAAKTGLIDA